MKAKILIAFLLSWQTVCPQWLYTATRSYFRQDPFKMEFSRFVPALMNDPGLTEKKINKKTDSTLFYLQGRYNSYYPFTITTTHCKIILAEQEEYLDSSMNNTFTYFVYQLIGYASPGEEGLNDVRQEYEKLHRRFKKEMEVNELKELKNEGVQSGAIMNYTFKNMVFYPVTVAWASSADHKENIIALSVRFFMSDNQAYLPIPPDSP